MHAILTSDAIALYINSQLKLSKSKEEKLINQVIDNANNKFILCKKLVEFYENNTFKDSNLKQYYESFLAHLISERSLLRAACNNDSESMVVKDLEKSYIDHSVDKHDILIIISQMNIYQFKSFRHSSLENNSLKDRLLQELLARNPSDVSFRSYDFSHNKDIEEIFTIFFKLSHNIEVFEIFDRYANLNHNLYVYLGSKSVCYYTGLANANNQNLENKKIILEKFKSCKIFRIKNQLIHERKLMAGKLILECDDDFANLDIERNTWKFSIHYCEKTFQNTISKKKLFTRDIR